MSKTNTIPNLKVVLLGDSNIGKTQLFSRIQYDVFQENCAQTSGASVSQKMISSYGKNINLQIWDTAGNEKFRSLTPIYFRNCKIVLLVFSVIDTSSFASVKYWVEQVKNTLQDFPKFILCGNKIDLTNREISFEEGLNVALEIDCDFIEISAKTGEGINDLLQLISDAAYKSIYSTATQTITMISLKRHAKEKKHSEKKNKVKKQKKRHNKKKENCC